MTGRRIGARIAAVLFAGLLAAACGTEPDTVEGDRDTSGSAQKFSSPADQVDRDTRFIYGTVTSVPDDLYYTAEIEIDDETFKLADVWTENQVPCGRITASEQKERLAEIMRELVPRGTKVVGTLASDSVREGIYLHPAPGTGPSVNEMLLRSGWAHINQSPRSDFATDREDVVAYMAAMDDAAAASEKSEIGGHAECLRADEDYERKLAQETARYDQQVADYIAAIEAGDVDIDIDLDWGDGRCTTCRIGGRLFVNLFR